MFSKLYFIHINSDGDKSYTIIADIIESYNFVVRTIFSFGIILMLK
jgi:hypothetical protein